MAHAVTIEGAALREMAHDAVGLVHALASCPMKRLAGVVLVVTGLTHFGDLDEGCGEVIEDAGAKGNGLAFIWFNRQAVSIA
jgi:hypothetical protein